MDESTTHPPRGSHPLLYDDYHEANRLNMGMTQEEYDAWWATVPKEEWPRFLRDDIPQQVMGPRRKTKPKPVRPKVRYIKGQIPAELRWQVWERDNFTCQKCGSRQFLHADHVIPESKGGPTTLGNLQTLCRDCNVRKGNRT